jgi:hypothetical protein
MKRERALKVVLVVGLLSCAGVYPLILMVKQDPALAMMMSLYATLGIFLFLASCCSLPATLSASKPNRPCGVVELCARDCHGDSGILNLKGDHRAKN